MSSIVGALGSAQRPEGRPVVVIADTIKGQGVSFMAGDFAWHMGVPTDEQLAIAMTELGAAGEHQR
jgi:transketolase